MNEYSEDFTTVFNNGLWSLEDDSNYFSWNDCEGCFGLAGTRYDIEFRYNLKDKDIYTLSLCGECLNKLANDIEL